MHLVWEDVGKLLFMNFIPMLHDLATRGQIGGILTIFETLQPIVGHYF